MYRHIPAGELEPSPGGTVVFEGGGYGSRTSAPIAANLLVKAQALGLLNPPPAQVASRQK